MIFSHSEWDQLVEETVDKINELAKKKGGEYAGDIDRLANFRRNGERLGLPMEVIWAVYCNKHIDAVNQYIADLNSGKERDRLEPIEGRVDDILVYLILFKAMLRERSEGRVRPHETYSIPLSEARPFFMDPSPVPNLDDEVPF